MDIVQKKDLFNYQQKNFSFRFSNENNCSWKKAILGSLLYRLSVLKRTQIKGNIQKKSMIIHAKINEEEEIF